MESVNDEVCETPGASRCVESSRKETSNIWKFFNRTGKDNNGVERAVCNYCGRNYAVGRNPKTNNNYGTSHLSRHVATCKSIAREDVDKTTTQEGESGMIKIDQKTHRKLLARAIVRHDLPFNFVEYESIREWMKYVSPNVVMTSRNTLVSDVQKIYQEEKERLKQALSRISNRVCLTSDVWTTSTTEGYICLTAHFVDESWRLVSKILNFCRMRPPHTGVELEAMLFDCMKQRGIEKKIFSITLDNASANDSMQDILKTHLSFQNYLLCDGEFFHVRCSAHILNLIVQEGLKVASEALFKIRESVKYVRGSDARKIRFRECMQETGVEESTGLKLDISTRWNSTYLMLESAIKFERAFELLKVTDNNYKYCPSLEEWRRAEKICEFLEPFYETTNLISGSSYPTSNLYFMQIYKIECMLDKYQLNEDSLISDMAMRMLRKFDKYWDEYSTVLAFGAIFDPRMKLEFLNFCYRNINPSTADDKVKMVREKFELLYKEYSNNFVASCASQPSNVFSTTNKSVGEGSKPKKSKIFTEFKSFQNERKFVSGKNELDLYFDDSSVDYDDSDDFDVLNYWKTNEKRFPTLSIMARDVLSIPITTVASESAFSIGGRVLTKYRSSTLPEHVQMLICTRNWLHGFASNPQDDDAEQTPGQETLSAELELYQEDEVDQ